ncbi:MAG: hypothetical protein E7353_04105 [Clostridiales bacterium]|nr:hypothetical protein [Clostridiales bacterium]
MKKRFLTLILSLTAMLMCVLGLSACGEKDIKFKLNFVVDNEIYATIDTSGDEVIQLPENPTKENHSFDGWFWDKDVWEKPFTANSLLDAPLSSDMSVYAKFSLNTINDVTFEDMETTYDGTEKTLAVSNLPNGASVTYDKANTYTNAGEYTVTATIIQENHEDLQLTATLTINKAAYDMSGVVFADKAVTYNGESHSITATNLPNGVTVEYTGNNQTNADEYTITATFTGDSANYEPIADKTATLTINKASVSKPAQDSTSLVYNGNEQTYQLAENSLYTISGNKQTNAGNYTVTVSLKDKNNYQWNDETATDLSYFFNIVKATYDMSAVVFADKTVTYNGESHSIFATGMPNGVSVSYENNNKINADEYTITAIFTGDSTNYNAIENKTATLTINKATYDMSGISFVGDTVTYDGNVHSLAITGTLPNGVTVSYENNDKTNADVYTVIAKFTDTTGNYENPANKTATLTINKATYNMDGVVFADKIVTYNGNAYSIEAQNVPSGLSVSYTGNDKTNVDTYTVTATFTDTTGNYENPQNMTATLTINKATIMGITLTDKTFTYDTKTHALAIDGNLPACVKVTYTNNDKVNANTYTATASFADTSGNYIVPNDMSAKLIINKATVSGITFDNKTFTYNGTKRSLEISGTLPEEVTVSYVNNGKINANTYNVTATFTCETENYVVPEDMTAVLTIKKAVYDMSNITFENKTVTYDGKVHSLAVSDNLPDGVTVTYENNDKISANQYIVTAIFTGDSINYYAIDDMQAMLTINKATYDMSKAQFVGGRFTYDGTPKSIYVTGNLPDGVIVNYTNNGKINANTYNVTATFTGDTQNYNKLPDWTASLIIDKATYDMSGVSFKNQTFTYDTTAKNALVTGTLPNGVEVSYVGNGKTDVGTYNVTAKFNGDSNNYHLIEDMTATIKINQAVPYIKEVSCNQALNVYSTVELIADTEVAGTIALDNGQTLTLGYKTYSWTFVPEDTHNYTNATGTVGLTVCALVSYYNDSVLFSSQNIVLNNSATVPTGTPLRKDSNGYRYTFSHWSIEENGVEYNFNNAITSDLNLYAVYDSEEIVYAINYYATKGVEHDNITTYTVSTEFTLLNLEKEHYMFNGWTDKNGNKITEIDKGTFGTIDLYAMWTPIPYTITYSLGYRGAKSNAIATAYTIEDNINFINASYDEYHIFEGWYLDQAFTEEKSSISVGESGDITLYAKWSFTGTYISTAQEFQNIAYNMAGAYELKNDIAINFTLGDSTNPFTGYFMGNDYTITANDCIFSTNNGNISYVKTNKLLSDVNNKNIYYCQAVGIAKVNNGNIEYCLSTGFTEYFIEGNSFNGFPLNWYIGGIVAYNTGTINACAVNIECQDVYSNSYYNLNVFVGMICGYSNNEIKNCYYKGNVDISITCGDVDGRYNGYLGGICGWGEGSVSITNCYLGGNIVVDWPNLYIGGDVAGSFLCSDITAEICNSFIASTSLVSVSYDSFYDYERYNSIKIFNGYGLQDDKNCFANQDLDMKEGTSCNIINFTSLTWIRNNLGWDESIWYLQDGQYPKLRFELE